MCDWQGGLYKRKGWKETEGSYRLHLNGHPNYGSAASNQPELRISLFPTLDMQGGGNFAVRKIPQNSAKFAFRKYEGAFSL